MSKKTIDTCKLCSFKTSEDKDVRDLFVEIEKRVLDLGHQQKDVMAFANERIQLLNQSKDIGVDPIPELNPMNLSRHFKRHVGQERFIAQKIQKEILKNAPDKYKPIIDMTNSEAFGKKKVDKYISDYISLSFLNDQMQIYISKFIEHINKQAVDGNFDEVTITEVNEYQKALKGLVETRQRLNDMQNSQSVAGLALEDALMRVSKSMISTVNDTMTGVRDEFILRDQGDLFDDIYKMIFESLQISFTEQIKEIEKQIRKRYGIS